MYKKIYAKVHINATIALLNDIMSLNKNGVPFEHHQCHYVINRHLLFLWYNGTLVLLKVCKKLNKNLKSQLCQ